MILIRNEKITGFVIIALLMAAGLPGIGDSIVEKGKYNDDFYSEFVPGEFIVKFKDNAFSSLSVEKLNEQCNILSMEKIFRNSDHESLENTYLLKVPSEINILSVINVYSSSDSVEYAEPNDLAVLCTIPNDSFFNRQWALDNTGQYNGTVGADIDAPEAWNIETGDPDIVIAILDTGVDYTHPDLKDNIWINTDEIPENGIDDDHDDFIDDIRGWDVHHDDNDPLDDVGHGTECAGIAGARGNNSIGISGVCWNCKIMPVKIGNFTHVSRSNIARGIKYAADNGAKVLSMSYVFNKPSYLERDALSYAYEKGVVPVAAAGNAGSSKKCYPAGYPKVIAVGGTDMNDSRMHVYVDPPDFPGMWISSNHGHWVDVAAPAVHIYTTTPTYRVFFNDYGSEMNYSCSTAGTSLSCPYVAGLAALILSKNPDLTPLEVKSAICNNSDPYASEVYIGKGRINAYQAVTKIKEIYLEKNELNHIPFTIIKNINSSYSNHQVHWTAEWEEQEGVLLAWPYMWPSLHSVYYTLIDELQEIGTVYLLCKNRLLQTWISLKLRMNNIPLRNIEWLKIPYASIWTRDYGPLNIYKLETGEWGLVDNKYLHFRDDHVNNWLHFLWDTEYYETSVIVQGGNLCTDGMGKVFCSEQILRENNHLMSEVDIRQIFKDFLNVEMIFFPEPVISPHLDMFAKLVDPETWVIGQWLSDSPNTPIMNEVVSIISNMTSSIGNSYNIFRIMQPPPSDDGLWRSYTNAYMQNGKVFVPTYGVEQDTSALTVYQEALPDWEIIGVDCNAFADIGGVIHCCTHGIAGHEMINFIFQSS